MKLASLSFVPVVTLLAVIAHEHLSSENKLMAVSNNVRTSELALQQDPGEGAGRMRCIEFKSQDFCRVELQDFEFDARFTVVSANVYFTGAGFKNVEKGAITSNSLKTIKNLMDRCLPGSIVVFDDVRVKGPDNEIRTIAGVTFHLF